MYFYKFGNIKNIPSIKYHKLLKNKEIYTIIINQGAVSYTHLDVYKRQVLSRTIDTCNSSANGAAHPDTNNGSDDNCFTFEVEYHVIIPRFVHSYEAAGENISLFTNHLHLVRELHRHRSFPYNCPARRNKWDLSLIHI